MLLRVKYLCCNIPYVPKVYLIKQKLYPLAKVLTNVINPAYFETEYFVNNILEY